MKLLSRVLSTLLGIGAVAVASAPAPAADLPTELKSGFFQWFHLTESCPPVAAENGQSWQCFRPSGDSFHTLVELDVLTNAKGVVLASQLGLDRAFIEGRNAPFARDIAKSYLGWAMPKLPWEFTGLVQNIADLSQAGGMTIIIHRDDGARPPDPDVTGGYDVFKGIAEKIALTRQGVTLTMTNIPGAFPAQHVFAAGAGMPRDKRWLRFTVQPSGKFPGSN